MSLHETTLPLSGVRRVNAACDSFEQAWQAGFCLKCLQKPPHKRYAGASDLADDVHRFLEGKPIQARPVGGGERPWRWCQRNRAVASLLTAVGLLLISIAGVSTFAAVNCEQARRDIAKQKEIAEANEKAATEREAETEAVLQFVEQRVFAAARPEGQAGGLAHDVTLRRAVKEALPHVAKSFPDRPLIEARLRMTLATSFWYLADAKTAAEQEEAARALYARHRGPEHPDTLRSMHSLANSYEALGRHADALKLREETLSLRKAKLSPEHPDTLRSMNNLANSYYALGRYADALKLFKQTVALKKAKLGPEHPDTLRSMYNLATMPWASTPTPSTSTRRRWPCGRPSSAPNTPTRSRVWATWPSATMAWAGTPMPSSSAKRRWRCGRPSSAPITPTRLLACMTWPTATLPWAGTPTPSSFTRRRWHL
jgi:hypothetical protein